MISNRSISTAYGRTFDMVKQSKASVDSTEWQTVYRFPFIVHARVFSRSKLYLTLITLISAPNAIVLYTLGEFIAFRFKFFKLTFALTIYRFRCTSLQRNGGHSVRYMLLYCSTLCIRSPFSPVDRFCLLIVRRGASQNFTFNLFRKSTG